MEAVDLNVIRACQRWLFADWRVMLVTVLHIWDALPHHASQRARLAQHCGMTPAALDSLRGPAGIYIGSRTPPEIAIAIMAEIIALKNRITSAVEAGVSVARKRFVAEQS